MLQKAIRPGAMIWRKDACSAARTPSISTATTYSAPTSASFPLGNSSVWVCGTTRFQPVRTQQDALLFGAHPAESDKDFRPDQQPSCNSRNGPACRLVPMQVLNNTTMAN